MAELQDIINNGEISQPSATTVPVSLNAGTFFIYNSVNGPILYVGNALNVPVRVMDLIEQIANFEVTDIELKSGNLVIESVLVDAENYVQRVFSESGEISDTEDVYSWFETGDSTQRVGNIRSNFPINGQYSFALHGQTGLGHFAGRKLTWSYKDVNTPSSGFDLSVAAKTLKIVDPQTVTALPATLSEKVSLVRFTITAPGTFTLRSATGSGDIVILKDATGNAATHNITIDGAGAETIDGAATLVMNTNRQVVRLYDAAVGIWEVI